jgi:alcohol dehydrogenase class IV
MDPMIFSPTARVTPFSLKIPPRIIFGTGSVSRLPEAMHRRGRHPLLVLGGRSFGSSDHFAALTTNMGRFGLCWEKIYIAGEPSPTMIDGIVADLAGSGIDLVVAIGGGAALDAGKAISAMLVEGGPVSRFLEGLGDTSPSGRRLPFIAVPTTAGTGSEATANAVLSEVGETGFKKSLRHDNFLPDLALVDPCLTLSCPPALTLSCAMDCFSQLVEGYLSTRASAITDALAWEGLGAIGRSLTAVIRDGGDLAARCDLAYAALLSGIVLANAGLGTVHGLASIIGGRVAIPHGLVCGKLMAPANRLTLARLRDTDDSHPALSKYAALGRLFRPEEERNDAGYQEAFIAFLDRLNSLLPLPSHSRGGLDPQQIARIASKADNKNNPVPLSLAELTTLLALLLA